MIPLQLTLKNFLSYHNAILDFHGLHTACICGANGAGKSSLLEAITWSLWGESRAGSDDDLIRAGAKDVRVDFIFISNQQTYRTIRTRRRGRSPSLSFQVQTESGEFQTLDRKGMRETQKYIEETLKLDYKTFINSAYLRQGHADEFMNSKPGDRKQVLADLLELNRYDRLASKAKDSSRVYKGKAEQLEEQLRSLSERLATRNVIEQELANSDRGLKQLQQEQDEQRQELQVLQALERDRQNLQQQWDWQQKQCQDLQKDGERAAREVKQLEAEIAQRQELIERTAEISEGYRCWLQLQQEEEEYGQKFQNARDTEQKRHNLAQQLHQQLNQLQMKLHQTQDRRSRLEQQETENQELLQKAADVGHALEKLQEARQRLQDLDRIQLQVAPLQKQRLDLEQKIAQAHAQLLARIEQLERSESQHQEDLNQVPQWRAQILSVDARIRELEKRKVYQSRLQEKEQERCQFRERLQENQRTYEQKIAELQQKLALLEKQDAVCPLCDRPLDEHYRNHAIEKTQNSQESSQQQIWVIREQMAVCERELQVLRAESEQISQALHPYNTLLQERGQLDACLENSLEQHERLQEIQAEKSRIEERLALGGYALELHAELQALNAKIQDFQYNEQTHSLVRGEVERWRWAEIQNAKLEDARQRQQQIVEQKPQLERDIDRITAEIEDLKTKSLLKQEIDGLEQEIGAIGYDRDRHDAIRTEVRQAQGYQIQYHNLQKAQQELPDYQEKLDNSQGQLQAKRRDFAAIQEHLRDLQKRLVQTGDRSQVVEKLAREIAQRRQQMDALIVKKGRNEEQLQQLDNLKAEYEKNKQDLQEARKQYRIHQELTQAFGKNGIQALMIENILPQLEAETNQILARLTGNQFHVQFLTQKLSKSSRSKKNGKLIDTLEIAIADVNGTRAYETYSGGEAFRINFSIRLALARLLAQRAGTSLQMLIVDEGFGTQDVEGCDRLIAAINAIASDFACILAVTHIPHFKEAFSHRIEVSKTKNGSQLTLCS
ncbi:MAG: exonuclease subunit SbcC [Jaaginema sp. PMC 1079.18]|nr:exonuclease subunit SbcC [Jaaginema sp. PMC 1080.18]MEC4849780.1 exonuclease subunit SbcC [Jaaginema sp. PMC 1079.18]MEC4865705.1 exonuclease subunit SbcC [Jaaginema sp. PMC 1078.18]